MHKKNSHILSGEVDKHLSYNEESEIKSEPEENDGFPKPTARSDSRPSTKRKPPAWVHDSLCMIDKLVELSISKFQCF